MDKSIERFFVKTYIDKDCQERLLFELNSMKKRSKALSRFSHDAETVLKKVLDKRIIAEVKRDLGLPMYDAPNAVEELKRPRSHPTAEMVEAIKDALNHFEII